MILESMNRKRKFCFWNSYGMIMESGPFKINKCVLKLGETLF